MNTVTVNARDISLPPWKDNVENFAIKVLDLLKIKNWDLSVLLCGDKTITSLNAQYRQIAEATDILSFFLGSEVQDGENTRYLPGDIVISMDTLRVNAKYFKTPEDEELRRLIIHGILHLNGMDHQTIDENEPMIKLQEKILKKLDKESILKV